MSIQADWDEVNEDILRAGVGSGTRKATTKKKKKGIKVQEGDMDMDVDEEGEGEKENAADDAVGDLTAEGDEVIL